MVEARRRSVKTPGPLSRMTPAKGALTGRKSAAGRVDTPRVAPAKRQTAGRLSRVAEKDARKSTGIPLPRKSTAMRKSTVIAPRKSGPIRKSTAAPKSAKKSVGGRKSVAKKSVGGRKSAVKKSVGGRKSAVKKSVGGRKSKPKRDSLMSARDSVASMKSAVSIEPPKRKRNSTINRKLTARQMKELEPEGEYDVFADEEQKAFPRMSFYDRQRKTNQEALALKKAQEEAHAAVPAPKKAKAKGRPKKAAKKPRKGRK